MKKRITRLIATLALGTLAITGYTLTDTLTATPQSDSGWGAPDTDTTLVTPAIDGATDISVTVVTPLDTAWG